MTMSDGYPFIFQMNDYSDADDLLEYTMQYRFRSTKSHHTYIVRVERYVEHAYCVKFFDKANMLSENKFSLRSGTFEPRTILYTLFRIMLDVLKRDPAASFFFIGAADEKDTPEMSTRRFRFYVRFVASVARTTDFEHYRVAPLSLYVLVNRRSVSDLDGYANRVIANVQEAFSRYD